MNLFKLHSKPTTLFGFKQKENLPAFAWDRLQRLHHSDGLTKSEANRLKKIFFQDPKYVTRYLIHFGKPGRRLKSAEPAIVNHPEAAVEYAAKQIKGRWPEAEPAILKDAFQAYKYARFVLKKRWKEAEAIIMTDIAAASYYANIVLKQRWKAAEPMILASDDWEEQVDYVSGNFTNRWPALEKVLLQRASMDGIMYYASSVMYEKRWKAAEPIILEKGSPYQINEYIEDNLRKRWKEAEEKLKADGGVWANYSWEFGPDGDEFGDRSSDWD